MHCLRGDESNVLGGPSGGKASPKARIDGAAHAGTRGNKRRRASSGEAHQVEKQRPPLEQPTAITRPDIQQSKVPTFGPTGEGAGDAIRRPLRAEDGRAKGVCGDRNRGDSGLNKAVTAPNEIPGTAADTDSHRCIKVSIAPLCSLDEGPSIGSGSTNTAESGGQHTPVQLSRILPVRSAPVSWRPLAATSASGAVSRCGSRKTPLATDENGHRQDTRKQQRVDDAVPAASVSASGITDGGCWESAVACSNASRTVGDGAGHANDMHKLPGVLAGSKLRYPDIADTCGGVVLRLTPGERSLEPWGTTLAPLRAICDIDPSLSRAGIEYRGVIHAVDGAQELKSYQIVKVNHSNASNIVQLERSFPSYSVR